MKHAPQIDFGDVPLEVQDEAFVLSEIARLEALTPEVEGCRVVAESADGDGYRVRIHVLLREDEVLVGKHPGQGVVAAEVEDALREAFSQARAQVRAYVDRRRGRADVPDAEDVRTKGPTL